MACLKYDRDRNEMRQVVVAVGGSSSEVERLGTTAVEIQRVIIVPMNEELYHKRKGVH